MTRLSRAIVASFFSFSLILSGFSFPATAVSQEPVESAKAALTQETTPESSPAEESAQTASAADASEQARQPARKRIILTTTDTGQYRLRYPMLYSDDVTPKAMIDTIDKGRKRVESFLGKFTSYHDLFVPGRISPIGAPPELQAGGLTWQDNDDEEIHVLVGLQYATSNVWTHELLHVRFRELGIRPPLWLEEGAAHYVQWDDGHAIDLYDILKRTGPLSKRQLKDLLDGNRQRGAQDEMRMRASGWAVLYYMVEIKDHKLLDVVMMNLDDLPEPQEAFDAIKALREQSSETSQESAEQSSDADNDN